MAAAPSSPSRTAPKDVRAGALVIFGGGGDLSMRMLYPSLYHLEADGLLPESFRIIATGRRKDDSFADTVHGDLQKRVGKLDSAVWKRLASRLAYMSGDALEPAFAKSLASALDGTGAPTVFFCAVSPTLYAGIAAALKKVGLADRPNRIVLEKPIGRDLASSNSLNDAVADAFHEDHVFRIDHYLGKETVQNLLALRFGNALFEPLWNNLAIDHVQITVAEADGVGDRWPYYDEYGALRDMLQNHMLQLLCLVAMEPPSNFDPDSVRNEKVKVLRSLRPISSRDVEKLSIRGQYTDGVAGGGAAKSYRTERGEPTDTETFVALRADIDNWRWAGVPFFLRTGKRLAERRTEIVIQFKPVPHSIFGGRDLDPNRLLIDIQPEEDITLSVMNKAPGLVTGPMRLESLPLSLTLGARANGDAPRRRIAYERLLLDVVNDNSTLFVRRDEIEAAWTWVDGVADSWAEAGMAVKPYAAGTMGPSGAFALVERFGREWND